MAVRKLIGQQQLVVQSITGRRVCTETATVGQQETQIALQENTQLNNTLEVIPRSHGRGFLHYSIQVITVQYEVECATLRL
jgi:hypothetical protein